MKLRDYLESVNEQVKHNPEILDYDVVYSSDAEGNSFEEVFYTPTIGNFDRSGPSNGWNASFNSETDKPNAICIN